MWVKVGTQRGWAQSYSQRTSETENNCDPNWVQNWVQYHWEPLPSQLENWPVYRKYPIHTVPWGKVDRAFQSKQSEKTSRTDLAAYNVSHAQQHFGHFSKGLGRERGGRGDGLDSVELEANSQEQWFLYWKWRRRQAILQEKNFDDKITTLRK